MENAMYPDYAYRLSRTLLMAGFVALAASVLSGCAAGGQHSSGSSGDGSTGIGNMTGGAEASPTSDPGVTPGKKP
jgi:hypothetical protein